MPPRSNRKRYAIVGAGMRARMYVDAIVGDHSDVAHLVALLDTNGGRIDAHSEWIVEGGGDAPLSHDVADLGDTIARHDIDRVIITSPDWSHAGHIVTALDAGADVIVEKPLTIDVPGAASIAAAIERTGRSVIVAFNYRYSPRNAALRELISSGAIGEVTSVHFEWLLDTSHGADYFRRWHRDKSRSGGLLVHKASHHFDLVNWWIADTPIRVFASGKLRFYGDRGAGRPNGERPERGMSDAGEHDAFSLDLRADPVLKRLYLDAEHRDGYRRDRDVFDAGITIEDNLSVVVDYRSGATMSYSLNAHAPWEGYTVAVNGTRGRAELSVVERPSVAARDAVDPSVASVRDSTNTERRAGERLLVQRHWDVAENVPIASGDGDHGGGDGRLLAELFRGVVDDPLHRSADWRDGWRAISVGVAGNRSLETGSAVDIVALGVEAGITESGATESPSSAAQVVDRAL